MACWGLSGHWIANPQYQYGWFVPALAVFAGYGRWQTRPAPGEPISKAIWVAAFCALPLPFVWLFLQPNPDWPIVNWLFVAEISVVTLAAIGWAGGWKWIKHFFVPAVLLWAAIPWPESWESPVIQGLMRLAAGIGVVVLDVIGIGAIQHGNVIEVASGVVGVDQACSGIRSLQGSLMAAIFLGEFFRFNAPRRFLLVAISILCALITNVVRVCFLAIAAGRDGIDAVGKWHDPAGFTTLAICVGAILCAALFLDRKSGPIRMLASVPLSRALPRWFAPALAALLTATLIGTELWYHESGTPPEGEWRVTPPANSKPVAISPSAYSLLRYDSAQGATWRESGNTQWLIYFFDWSYGPAFARLAARTHNPAICLPAGGRELEKERGELVFTANGNPVSFHGYVFDENGTKLHVYHGVWQTRSERGLRHGPLHHSKHFSSLQTVLWRERYVAQQAAEIAVWGCNSEAEADAALQRMLPSLFHSRSAAPTASTAAL
jgi:exosortase